MHLRTYQPNRGPVPAGPLHFIRRADGAVEIWRDATADERITSYDGPQYRRVTILAAPSWASLVSSLSARGEDRLTFSLALTFHTGGSCAYDPDAEQHSASEPFPPPLDALDYLRRRAQSPHAAAAAIALARGTDV